MTNPVPSPADIARFGLKPIPMVFNHADFMGQPMGERVNLYHESSVASLIARIHLLEAEMRNFGGRSQSNQ